MCALVKIFRPVSLRLGIALGVMLKVSGEA